MPNTNHSSLNGNNSTGQAGEPSPKEVPSQILDNVQTVSEVFVHFLCTPMGGAPYTPETLDKVHAAYMNTLQALNP